MTTTESELHLEIVKLLVQVAWADHDVAEEETRAVIAFARRHGLASGQLEEIEQALRGEAPLPPPNLGALRPHRQRVITEVQQLLESDLKIEDEENEILEQITMLLGG